MSINDVISVQGDDMGATHIIEQLKETDQRVQKLVTLIHEDYNALFSAVTRARYALPEHVDQRMRDLFELQDEQRWRRHNESKNPDISDSRRSIKAND